MSEYRNNYPILPDSIKIQILRHSLSPVARAGTPLIAAHPVPARTETALFQTGMGTESGRPNTTPHAARVNEQSNTHDRTGPKIIWLDPQIKEVRTPLYSMPTFTEGKLQ